MKGQNCVRQLHLDGSLALRLKVSDNGVQGLTWQGGGQPCADFERPIQIELRRGIIPLGNIRPESPGKLLRRVALDRILKLQAGSLLLWVIGGNFLTLPRPWH